MKLKNLVATAALTIVLAACGQDAADLAVSDSVTDTPAPTSSTVQPVALPLVDDEPVVAQPVSNDLVSNTPTPIAPTTTEAAPTTTVAPTTTQVPPTTNTTTVAPDDLGGDPACATQRYELVLPESWDHRDCTIFTEGEAPGPEGFEFGYRPEIDFAFTTSETFSEALRRIDETETILSSETTTVNGNRAVRLEIDEGYSEYFSAAGRRTTYVVDAGDGVFFAAGAELVDPFDSPAYASVEARYVNTVAVLDLMMSNVAIIVGTPASVSCPATINFPNSEEINSGQADVNADGDLETIRLIQSGDDRIVTIEGLVPGIVHGVIDGYPDPMSVLGWADWDLDGVPEIITREGAGPAAGDIYHVSTVVGCDIVLATSLLSTGSTQYSDAYICEFGADGAMTSLTTTSMRLDVSQEPFEITRTRSESTYAAGAVLRSEPTVTVSNDSETTSPYDTEVNAGLEPCGNFFPRPTN